MKKPYLTTLIITAIMLIIGVSLYNIILSKNIFMMCGNSTVDVKANCTTYSYYENVKYEFLCNAVGGEWGIQSVDAVSTEACYVKLQINYLR